jgi:hypothetical protein
MKLSHLDYTQDKNWLNNSDKQALLELITASFSGIDAEQYFTKYFSGNDAFTRKLRLYFDHDKVVGYCLITFSKVKQDVLIRASAAFYPEYRTGGNTFTFSMKQAFLYWLQHPQQNIYYADTMLSPAMYRAMAKKAAIVWPSEYIQPQAKALFEQFNSQGQVSELLNLRCLLDVGRRTNYSEQEISSFRNSDKTEINFYCRANPDFDKGNALFVIMPITLKQLLLTAVKLLNPSK